MFERIKTLTLHTLIYGVGHVLARLVTFLLLPLYTNVFSPEEYGVVSLAYTFMGFMIVVLHYGLDAALMKYYVPADERERKEVLTNAYLSFIVTSVVFVFLLYLFRDTLDMWILGKDIPHFISLIGWILMFDVLWSIPMLVLRSEEQPGQFIGLSLLNVGLSLGLNLLLVLKYKMGVEGVLVSNLITSGILFLLTLPIIWRRMDLGSVAPSVWKKLMRFGFPFLPSGIFAMLMELADRYILKLLMGLETVGLYSAGYKLGMLMLLIVMGFNMGWQPFFLREGPAEEKQQLFSRITTYVLLILGFFWIVILLWADPLVRMKIGGVSFYGQEYWSATRIVPLIALGYVFHGAYLLQLPGVFLKERSGWVAWIRGVGAAANIGLNFLLIPHYGILGAAAATCISFLVMAVVLFGVNRTLYPIQYEWSRLVRIGIAMALITAMYAAYSESILIRVGLTLLYPVGLFATGFLQPDEKVRIKKGFSS